MIRTVAAAALAGFFASLPGPSAFAYHPWHARRPPANPPSAHQLRDLGQWPPEPATPAEIDPKRFAASVDYLCRRGSTSTAATDEASPASLGELVRVAATDAGVDPFTLAGLMFEMSRCHADHTSSLGTGLLGIHPSLYFSPGAPPPPDATRQDFTQSALRDPARNLRLGAKLLRMWQDTHDEMDKVFVGVPHRGPVAHFIWGDVVHSSGGEDLVLTARRRLLAFYSQAPAPTTETSVGQTFVCPLEGAPRVASGPGEDRAGGRRQHRGIDIVAAIGEPVRSVAAGTVIFAGANVPGAPRRSLPPARVARYRWRRLGPGGIYVCIQHAPERHVVTCYMHLDTYTVTEGDAVAAGEEIGRVGRTGVQVSPPHLHFEVRVDDRHMNPARFLTGLVIPPKATQTYLYVMHAKRMRLARAKSDQARGEKL